MKFVTVTGMVALLLPFGPMMPLDAQHDGQGERQIDKQEEKQGKPDRPKGRQDEGAPQPDRQPQHTQAQRAGQSRPQRKQQQQKEPQVREQLQPQRPQQQALAWQQQRGWLQHGSWKGHDTWQENRAQRWSSDSRTWAQRGGYGGAYIPQDRFNVYFGNQHIFRIRSRPTMYLGFPRFEYGGFSFLLVDPYPEYWADNWYDFDDVYIDYDDGYYLNNRTYPQVKLAIAIAL